jgi:membrane glycosyltransferase
MDGCGMTISVRPKSFPDSALQHLDMPDQNLRHAFTDSQAPGLPRNQRLWLLRVALLMLPVLLTGLLAWTYLKWFTLSGPLTVAAAGLTVLTAFTFFWVVLSVGTAIVGLVQPVQRAVKAQSNKKATGIDVAILLPMYGEPASETIQTAVALLKGLHAAETSHRFSLHVLSDSRKAEDRAAEARVVRNIQQAFPHLDVHYRWRAENTDFKSGNLREWVTTKGQAYEGMLVLDADSVMDRGTVLALADLLSTETHLGLVQTVARLLPGRTLWQRLQEFSAHVYGVTLGRGLSVWAGNEANFMGHNAMLRTRAFAACAGLPKLSGRRPLGGVILSHDFVEAALLRRAGWGVRLLPDLAGSYEDTPETTVGYIRRDRRWCQGNMQHLKVISAKGLHPVSRFHLMQGAMAYLASVTWFVLFLLWVIVGDETSSSGWRYFADGPAPMTIWPDMPWVTHAMIAGAILLTLLLPKLIGAIDFIRRGGLSGGSATAFAGTMLLEMVVSLLIAPMMMIQHLRAVLRTFAGFDTGWAPHEKGQPRLWTLLRFHGLETLTGLLLIGCAVTGYLSFWLVPTAVCLALAAPFAWVLALKASNWPLFRFAKAADSAPHLRVVQSV